MSEQNCDHLIILTELAFTLIFFSPVFMLRNHFSDDLDKIIGTITNITTFIKRSIIVHGWCTSPTGRSEDGRSLTGRTRARGLSAERAPYRLTHPVVRPSNFIFCCDRPDISSMSLDRPTSTGMAKIQKQHLRLGMMLNTNILSRSAPLILKHVLL